MTYADFNLNEQILFRPTKRAEKIYLNYIEKLKMELIESCPNLNLDDVKISSYLTTDKFGNCKMQMWHFMQIFGSHFTMGSEPIAMDMTISIPVKE